MPSPIGGVGESPALTVHTAAASSRLQRLLAVAVIADRGDACREDVFTGLRVLDPRRGRDPSGGVNADGEYRVRVHLLSEHRTIVFPNLIRLDTVAPVIDGFNVTRRTIHLGERTRITYRFSKSAHPIVFVDGREAVYGRFAHSSGTVDWFGKVASRPVRRGVHRLILEARDAAGNTSRATEAVLVRVRAHPAVARTHRHETRKR